MFLSSNLKLLRKRKGLTQDEASEQMKISRTKINAYENEHSEPTIEGLVMFATYYGLNIDTLVKTDLSCLSDKQLEELENGFDSFITGSKLRVLSSTVDQNDNENIELVPIKAIAGYTNGYSDPDFISQLPTFQLPFLSKDRKYRTFQIDGDSMYPIKDKSYVIGEFVQNWIDIKDGAAYIILTSDDGIVFKVAFNHIKKDKTLFVVLVLAVKKIVYCYASHQAGKQSDSTYARNGMRMKFLRASVVVVMANVCVLTFVAQD
jgi:transcriptional regulator with XRE-family HTH domain